MELPISEREIPTAIIGGHICLDIIPRLRMGDFDFRAGTLEEIGEATISTGGCVSNTGVSLSRLGASVEVVSRIGDDMLGDLLRACLRSQSVDSSAMRCAPGELTSYSVILSPGGIDRMVLHYPGTNNTFEAADLREAFEKRATFFHFGYPPLMRKMYSDGGGELSSVFKRAKASGLITSLDMAYPDPVTPAGHANWYSILAKVLPAVGLFLPSYEEIVQMLLGPARENFRVSEEPDAILLEQLEYLSSTLLAMGTPVVAIKLGTRGLYLRTGRDKSLERLVDTIEVAEWANRELWTTTFSTEVVGTNGAGDRRSSLSRCRKLTHSGWPRPTSARPTV